MIWLVLDCHYLCHRAFHSSRDLSFGGRATGTIFGFLQSILILKQEFQTDGIAFCFEAPDLQRRVIFSGYKKRRYQQRTPEEEVELKDLARQITALREDYLPAIGFRNIFRESGMESDDLMAAIAADANEEDLVVLVTSDQDLFQCLRKNVIMYCPRSKTHWSAKKFERSFGIPPEKWALVKAMAGCKGDEVPGISGIGEKTALKYLRGELDPTSKAHHLITENWDVVRNNKALVKLPFNGCPVPRLELDDRVTSAGWLQVCGELGFRRLAGRVPMLGVKVMGV